MVCDTPWVTVSHATGTVQCQATSGVAVIIDRTDMHPGIYTFTLELLSDGNTQTIEGTMRVPTAFDKIVFSSVRNSESKGDIYVMDMDGPNEKRLTIWLADEIQPYISPNGNAIIYSQRTGVNFQIYVMDTDGSNNFKLTDNDISEQFPRFGENGGILYTAFNNETDSLLYDSEIYTCDWEGKNVKQLTNYTNQWTHQHADW